MLQAIIIWHGLHLAQKVLGDSMPKAEIAGRVLKHFEDSLDVLAKKLQSRNKHEDSFDSKAVSAWQQCKH